MLTRCRWPPDNSCGKRRPNCAGLSPTAASRSCARLTAALRRTPCTWGAKAMLSCHRHARVQRAVAVLEHHLHLAAIFLQRQFAPQPTVSPSKMISPAVVSISAMIRREVVDLPQPDSPTTPRVSPLRTSKLTSSTACTDPALRPRKPVERGKMFGEAGARSARAAPGRRRPVTGEVQGGPWRGEGASSMPGGPRCDRPEGAGPRRDKPEGSWAAGTEFPPERGGLR